MRFMFVRVCLLVSCVVLLSTGDCWAGAAGSAAVEVAPGVELVAGTGVKRVWLPSYSGADTVYSSSISRSAGNTLTSYSGSIDCNSVSVGLNVDTSLSSPLFRSVRLVSRVDYAEGDHHQSASQSLSANNYIMGLSVDPRYNWVGTVGTSTAATYTESVRIEVRDVDWSLGFEGRGAELALADMSVTPVAYAGFTLQDQRSRVWTDIVRQGTGEYDRLDERLRSLQWGPELRAGLEFALPWDVNMALMGRVAWLQGDCSLDADQRMYFTNSPVAASRAPGGSASHSVEDSYDTVMYGASLKVEKPIVDSLLLGLELTATHWTDCPGIVNPTSIDRVPTSTIVNPGVRIGYDDADELGVMLRLAYSF